MNSSYTISNRSMVIIKNVIPDNQYDQQFIDTLKSLQGLKNSLKNGTISQSQFLLQIREIKQQSEEINALFKPTSEFNYWFRGNNYRADRMAKIIEHSEKKYTTLLQREQSIISTIKDRNFHSNVDPAKKDSAKNQSYVVEASRESDSLENLIGQLEVWVTEAPDNREREARLTAKSRILDAYDKNLNFLYLNKLGLTTLPIGVFNHLTELKGLYLYDNRLSSLPAGIFNGLTNLQELGLSSNHLRVLPDGVFNGLTRLKKLDLSFNQLRVLPDGVFNGLANLQELSLYFNQLSELTEGVFDSLTNLERLPLYHNQLSVLPDGVFNGLTKLGWMSLSNNQLSTLPDGVFNRLTKLQELSLSYNQLSVLPDGVFNGLTELEWLNFSNNRLSALPNGVFNGLAKLRRLYLGNNQLSTLPDGVFNGLTRLIEVELDNNRFNIETVHQIRNSFRDSNTRIDISVYEQRRASPITNNLTIMNRLNKILKDAESDYQLKLNWNQLKQHDIFNAFLEKIPQMADVKNGSEDKATAVYHNLAKIIRAMDHIPELRETCFNLARESTETCGDRVAFGFIQMQLQVKLHKLHKLNSSLSELITQQKAMCALEIIYEIAGAKAKSARGVIDEIEIYLTYIKHLKDYLQVEITDMLYESLSDIKQGDINAARKRLGDTLTDDYVYAALADSDIAKERYASEFEAIQNRPEFEAIPLDGESDGAYQERMKNLENSFKEAKVNFLKQQLKNYKQVLKSLPPLVDGD